MQGNGKILPKKWVICMMARLPVRDWEEDREQGAGEEREEREES